MQRYAGAVFAWRVAEETFLAASSTLLHWLREGRVTGEGGALGLPVPSNANLFFGFIQAMQAQVVRVFRTLRETHAELMWARLLDQALAFDCGVHGAPPAFCLPSLPSSPLLPRLIHRTQSSLTRRPHCLSSFSSHPPFPFMRLPRCVCSTALARRPAGCARALLAAPIESPAH